MSKEDIICYGLAGITICGLFGMILGTYKDLLNSTVGTEEETTLIVKIGILILAIGYVSTVFPVNINWK